MALIIRYAAHYKHCLIVLTEVLVLLVYKLSWLRGGDSVSSFIEILLLIIVLVVILTRRGSIQLENKKSKNYDDEKKN